MPAMQRLWLLAAVLLLGCQPATPATNSAPQEFVSVDLLRRLDYSAVSRNDTRTLTDPQAISRLESFFPQLETDRVSNLHADWYPWIVIQFKRADGSMTDVASDYRLYRIDDAKRGDFVAAPGFADFVEQLFALPPSP